MAQGSFWSLFLHRKSVEKLEIPLNLKNQHLIKNQASTIQKS